MSAHRSTITSFKRAKAHGRPVIVMGPATHPAGPPFVGYNPEHLQGKPNNE